MIDVTERPYTAARVLRLTGLSKRQLQYWEETELIRPSLSRPDGRGRGRARLYDFRDLVELKTAARLRGSISLQLIRRICDYLRSLDYEKPLADIRFFETRAGDVVFVEQGTVRSAQRPEQTLVDVTVDLPGIVEELKTGIAELDVRQVGAVERRRGTLGGKWVIAGTRIPVDTVKRLVGEGLDLEQIRELYPDLTAEDVHAALAVPSVTPRRRAAG